jgi:glycerol-3-phosphate dehydrogenase (NAD(P)+)
VAGWGSGLARPEPTVIRQTDLFDRTLTGYTVAEYGNAHNPHELMSISRIGVIGAGAWGTAMAQALRAAGSDVVLWAFEEEVVRSINQAHENTKFLPGIALDPLIRATDILNEAAQSEAVLLVTPAQHLRRVSGELAGALPGGTPVVICAKGIEQGTAALLSEVAAETLPHHPLAILSGPTFAAEVAQGRPTAVTLATSDKKAGEDLVAAIGSARFRPYLTDDVVGAEIGGAVKNVIAIACGIAHGRGFGDNTRAALITRGLAEITRLGLAKGGRLETMMGLAGLGDLTLTCTSTQSRNYSLGEALGKGETLQDVLGARVSVAEGVFSAEAVSALALRNNVEMPISNGVDAILKGTATVDQAIEALMSRPFRSEMG